jgi:predicted DNA-binding transcriptional regulator YafY
MKQSDSTRLARLDVITARLKGDDPLTIEDLAREMHVSIRTIARDIALLRERGLPIEADRGRGGGIRLPRHWGVGRLSLTHREAVELLISLAIAEQLPFPWLITSLTSIRSKIAASFSSAFKDRISSLRSRILIGNAASTSVLQTFSGLDDTVSDAVLTGFLEQRIVEMSYRDVEGRLSNRRIEPQLLLLNAPVWYVIAWDHGREAVRSFRCDRIQEASVAGESFFLRPASAFADAIVDIDAIRP